MVHMFKHSIVLLKCLRNGGFRTFCSQSIYYNYKQLHTTHINTTSHILSTNRPKMDFMFCDYDLIGFDLDNTLCEYNLKEMVPMEYNVMADFLIEKGYPADKLKGLDDFSLDFMQRGLILDFERGNILKLDRTGGIMKATHGSKPLAPQEVIEIYGPRATKCPILSKMKNNLTDAWEPECLSKYRILLDYFDLPASVVFSKCVDFYEEKGNQDFAKCGEDVISALKHMYNRANFPTEESAYFKNLRAEPEKYINRCPPSLLNWLRILRKKKSLFLVTGSNCDLADFVSRYSLGPEWKDFFDLVVSFSRKPFFFTQKNDFYEVVDLKEGGKATKIEKGGFYTQGNYSEVQSLLSLGANRPETRALYFGDNLVQDVFTPTKFNCCDSVAIVEEMNTSHPSHEFINSQFWGPFQAEGSWWGNIIKNYSKAHIPSINYLTR